MNLMDKVKEYIDKGLLTSAKRVMRAQSFPPIVFSTLKDSDDPENPWGFDMQKLVPHKQGGCLYSEKEIELIQARNRALPLDENVDGCLFLAGFQDVIDPDTGENVGNFLFFGIHLKDGTSARRLVFFKNRPLDLNTPGDKGYLDHVYEEYFDEFLRGRDIPIEEAELYREEFESDSWDVLKPKYMETTVMEPWNSTETLDFYIYASPYKSTANPGDFL